VGALAALIVVWLGPVSGVTVGAILALAIILGIFWRSRKNAVHAGNAMSEVADSGHAVKVKRNPPPTRRQRAIMREQARLKAEQEAREKAERKAKAKADAKKAADEKRAADKIKADAAKASKKAAEKKRAEEKGKAKGSAGKVKGKGKGKGTGKKDASKRADEARAGVDSHVGEAQQGAKKKGAGK